MALVLLKLLLFVLGFGVAPVRVFDLVACLALARVLFDVCVLVMVEVGGVRL